MNTSTALCRRMPLLYGILYLALTGLLPATAVAGTTTDEPAVKARDVLPPEFFRSVHYEIDDNVTRSRFFYHFRVSSDFGTYSIASLPMLRVRLHEIMTLAEVSQPASTSSASLDRSPPGRRGVGGDSVAEIFADPLGTASTLLGNLAYNLEETLADPDRIRTTAAPADDRGFNVDPGPHKRSAAAQLDVDVYSSNPALQTLLDSLARARSAGKMRGPIAPTQALPVGPVAFGSGVLDERLRSILKNQSAAEINANVEQRLAAAGVSAAARTAFLANRNYTPRTRLYFARYLALMKQATGIEHIVHSANSASTEADAHAFVDLARMAAYYELTGSHIVQVIAHRNFPVMLSDAGVLVVALPIDHFSWTDDNAALVASLDSFIAAQSPVSTTILVSGGVTDAAKTQFAARNIRLRERYSF
jgi:hypothetical protein